MVLKEQLSAVALKPYINGAFSPLKMLQPRGAQVLHGAVV